MIQRYSPIMGRISVGIFIKLRMGPISRNTSTFISTVIPKIRRKDRKMPFFRRSSCLLP